MAKYFSVKWQMFFFKTPMDFGYDLAVSVQGQCSKFRVQSSKFREAKKKSHIRATLCEIFLIPLVP